MVQVQAPEIAFLLDTETFLSSFSFSLITVSLVRNNGTAHIPEGKYFGGPNRVRSFSVPDFYEPDVQNELIAAQTAGFGVYFTMNEGNGLPAEWAEEGNLNCGKKTNITTLKALAIDTDTGDAKALMQRLADLHFLPHYIVESSPGRYHFYFLIEPALAEGEAVLQWQALQRHIASLVPNLDQSLTDVNQLLRIPNYLNFKYEKAFKVRIIRRSPHAYYKLAELCEQFGVEPDYSSLRYKVTGTNANGAHVTEYVNGHAGSATGINGTPYTPFEYPKGFITEGNRRTSITRFLEHLMQNQLPLDAPEELYFMNVNAFIKEHIAVAEQHLFLPGGERRKNIEQYFYDQRAYRIQKVQSEQARVAVQEMDHEDSIDKEGLPDDFYLNFPGEIGTATREYQRFDPTLSVELAFACALNVAGSLKADSWRFQGYWPMVNGLVLATTGAGKSTIKHMIEETLRIAGIVDGQFPQHLGFQTSVQSLHTQVYKAGGVASILVDEAGDYMKAMTSKNAPTYALLLKQYFKNGTTGRENGTTLTPGESLSLRVPARFLGMIQLWMLIQPEMFSGRVTFDDLRDGFLPRFMFFRGRPDYHSMFKTDITDNTAARIFVPSLDMRVWVEALASRSQYAAEGALLPEIDLAVAAFRAANRRARREDIERVRMDTAYQLRSAARMATPKVQVKLTQDAETCLRAYMNEWRERALNIAALDTEDARLDVIARVKEMTYRLVANTAPLSAVVGEEHMNAVIKFHRHETDLFMRKELSEMGENKDMKTLITGITKACKKHGDAVTVKQIMQNITSTKRPQNFGLLLKEAVAQGVAAEMERPHSRVKNKKVNVYRILHDLED